MPRQFYAAPPIVLVPHGLDDGGDGDVKLATFDHTMTTLHKIERLAQLSTDSAVDEAADPDCEDEEKASR